MSDQHIDSSARGYRFFGTGLAAPYPPPLDSDLRSLARKASLALVLTAAGATAVVVLLTVATAAVPAALLLHVAQDLLPPPGG